MSDERYCRIYWSVMSDPKFDGIREDVRLFGSWTLMLLVADMAWPAPAFLPPTVTRSSVTRLSECGLVDLLPGRRFRIHGMDKERTGRAQHATKAARDRWSSNAQSTAPGNAPSNAQTMPSKAEQSKEEQSTSAREGLPHISSSIARLLEELTGVSVLAIGDRVQTALDQLCERHGGREVSAAMVKVARGFKATKPSPIQLVYGTRNLLEPIPSAAGLAESDVAERRAAIQARPKPKEDRAAVNAEMARMLKDAS